MLKRNRRILFCLFLFWQVLKDVALQPGGTFHKEHLNTKGDIYYSELPEGIKGFYFSANWVRRPI